MSFGFKRRTAPSIASIPTLPDAWLPVTPSAMEVVIVWMGTETTRRTKILRGIRTLSRETRRPRADQLHAWLLPERRLPVLGCPGLGFGKCFNVFSLNHRHHHQPIQVCWTALESPASISYFRSSDHLIGSRPRLLNTSYLGFHSAIRFLHLSSFILTTNVGQFHFSIVPQLSVVIKASCIPDHLRISMFVSWYFEDNPSIDHSIAV